VEQLLVLGGGASTAELCEQLGGRLGIGVKVVSPSEVVEYPAGLGEICASPALIGAIGLAQYEG
jgi:Tfp pilus assembly PilM family ATPase